MTARREPSPTQITLLATPEPATRLVRLGDEPLGRHPHLAPDGRQGSHRRSGALGSADCSDDREQREEDERDAQPGRHAHRERTSGCCPETSGCTRTVDVHLFTFRFFRRCYQLLRVLNIDATSA